MDIASGPIRSHYKSNRGWLAPNGLLDGPPAGRSKGGGAMKLPEHAFFGGRIVPYSEARVGVMTHGLNYGTGVFAGLRAYWNAEEQELFVFHPLDHFRRFLESARLLGMQLPWSPEELVGHLLELIRTEGLREDSYARPLAFYADEIIGVRLHDLTPQVSMVTFPFGNYVDNEE